MELTTAIQSEQHVKKELARRMGELQENLHNVKEQVRYSANYTKINFPDRFFIVKCFSLCTFVSLYNMFSSFYFTQIHIMHDNTII